MNIAGIYVPWRQLVADALGGLLVLAGFIAFCAVAVAVAG